jgi:hypothetical protein
MHNNQPLEQAQRQTTFDIIPVAFEGVLQLLTGSASLPPRRDGHRTCCKENRVKRQPCQRDP